MPNELDAKIQARLEELPEDVQKAVRSAELGQKIQSLAKKYALHIDQAEALDIETRLVMLGFTDPEAFPAELKNNVRISAEQSEALSQDISNEIFLPIRESMQQYMEERALQAELKNLPPEKPELSIKPSVIMPSAANAASVSEPAPTTPSQAIPTAQKPAAPIAPQTNVPASTPTPKPPTDMHAELMLTQSTVSVPPKVTPPPAPVTPSTAAPVQPASAPAQKAEAPKPSAPYKADPYREPPE